MAWSVGEKKTELKRTGPNKVVEMRSSANNAAAEAKSSKERDLAGGMEMLEMDFLLGVIESTKSNDKNNVMLQKVSFNELVRRGELKTADSKALKAYAINKGSLYDKRIQYEALKELAQRTGAHSG